jgi:2-hydroxycyclohexanecarboxyl-CoA dehydrogenase
MTRLNGKVAIVTGAAQGIGRAIASRLADEGAKVALADIQFDSAERAASEIRAGGASAIAVALDVTRLDDAIAAADRVERELGPIDILVNNAGWDILMPFVETTPDLWDKVISINYRGVLNCCKAIAPRMQARGSGKIISISSDAGRVGSSGEAVYAGCKAAIIGFSKTLARELAANHINVNVVCPGPTDTALLKTAMAGREKVLDAMARGIPFRRLGQPSDLAGAVAFFASPDSDFVTGQVLSVSGGLTMAG